MDIKKNIKRSYILTSVMAICFLVYTILVATVEVNPVGEYGSEVGFSSFNKTFYDMLRFNETLYKVSDILGYLALGLVAIFALVGVVQLIKGKSLKKVDAKLYVLACYYAAMFAIYILFEKLVINYRPVIVDASEGLEPSYPSSHTFLSLCVCMSAIVMYTAYIKNKKLRLAATIATVILMISVIVLRFLSGVHWATDIVGSLILGSALFSAFVLALNILASKKKN